MALDLSHLQLIFNVFAITGVTSLTLICRMLKRDNEKLTIELTPYRDQSGYDAKIPKAMKAPEAAAKDDQDIRQYVSRRMQGWLELQEADKKSR